MTCPSCGSDEYRSNRVSEAPFAAAAKFATGLRDVGEIETACDVLTRLAAVRIANFLSFQWKCDGCGVRFDG